MTFIFVVFLFVPSSCFSSLFILGFCTGVLCVCPNLIHVHHSFVCAPVTEHGKYGSAIVSRWIQAGSLQEDDG